MTPPFQPKFAYYNQYATQCRCFFEHYHHVTVIFPGEKPPKTREKHTKNRWTTTKNWWKTQKLVENPSKTGEKPTKNQPFPPSEGILDFLHEARQSSQQHRVLVNCVQGISRSPAVAAGALRGR